MYNSNDDMSKMKSAIFLKLTSGDKSTYRNSPTSEHSFMDLRCATSSHTDVWHNIPL